MTKRIISGVVILTALGALGVILAGALTSGEQLIVRFLTAVIVAGLGLYVISDLRMQANDGGDRGPARSSRAAMTAPPNSTAAFMNTTVETDGPFASSPDEPFGTAQFETFDQGQESPFVPAAPLGFDSSTVQPFLPVDVEPRTHREFLGEPAAEANAPLPPRPVGGRYRTGETGNGAPPTIDVDADTLEAITAAHRDPVPIGEGVQGGGSSHDRGSFVDLRVEPAQHVQHSDWGITASKDREAGSADAAEPMDGHRVRPPTIASAVEVPSAIQPSHRPTVTRTPSPVGDLDHQSDHPADHLADHRSGDRPLTPAAAEEEAGPATIDLRSVPVGDEDHVQAAIAAGEREVVRTLIERGMLSTSGPITERDVRTMVYVAFTSNELRKLILAGGRPGQRQTPVEMGDVELFDERRFRPTPRTYYTGVVDPATARVHLGRYLPPAEPPSPEGLVSGRLHDVNRQSVVSPAS